jgi:hypothetical protein
MRGQSETISGNFRDPLVFYKQGKNDWWTLSVDHIYEKLVIKKISGWEEVTDRQRAQDLANSGKYVLGVSLKVIDANTEEKITDAHVAVVAPGKPSTRKIGRVEYICPAVAQQGGQGSTKNYLYGITTDPDRQTVAWSWNGEAYKDHVIFLVYKK